MEKFKYYYRRLVYFIFYERFNKNLKYHWNLYPKRFDIINKIIKKNNYTNYLEIGCFKNENFDKIIVKNKIGVDPNSGGTLRMTSDQFFATNNNKYDLIFIDGLHVYEQVKKDIKNSLQCLNDSGIILIHDCLPRKLWYQTPKRMSFTWNGDVWKALVECRTQKIIDTYTLIADEGIGVIFKRNNNNLLKLETNNFKKLTYRSYISNHNKFMNLISVEKFFEEIIK